MTQTYNCHLLVVSHDPSSDWCSPGGLSPCSLRPNPPGLASHPQCTPNTGSTRSLMHWGAKETPQRPLGGNRGAGLLL